MLRNAPFSSLAAALAAFALAAEVTRAQVPTTVRVATGLNSPVDAVSPPGDAARLFIVEQGGRIRILKDGGILAAPFLDITSKVNSSGNERGLLGLAFHPAYDQNGFFYVDYTGSGGATFVERYSADPSDANLALPSSGVTVIGPIAQPQSNHNGGCIRFGPDGALYIGMGDGGNFNDTGTGHAAGGNAQSGGTLLGKMLRLDVDIPSPHVPPGNPFVGDPNILDEIWAFGLRNPWRFSFDRETGDAYIADVGQGAREEIDLEPPGAGGRNYGWRCMEGFSCTGLSGCTCNAPSLTLPVHEYTHSGGNCSVTGGYVYRGCAIPGLFGAYLFADYCSGQIWSFEWNGASATNLTNRTAQLDPPVGSIDGVTSFGEDGAGELYIVDRDGEIYKIVPDSGGGIFTYCQAKLSSQLCLPDIGFQGAPTASGSTPFEITSEDIDAGRIGILFYGFGQNNAPFRGGVLCVQPPLKRTPPQSAGGTPPPSTCSGSFSFDMGALIQSGLDPGLTAGASANAQFWYRDPPDAFGTGLTDALEFLICSG